jgi:hypothetical protein
LYTISVGIFVGPLLERIVAAVVYSPNMVGVFLTVSIVREALNCEKKVRRQRVLWHSCADVYLSHTCGGLASALSIISQLTTLSTGRWFGVNCLTCAAIGTETTHRTVT